jgi:hypothetical protein
MEEGKKLDENQWRNIVVDFKVRSALQHYRRRTGFKVCL